MCSNEELRPSELLSLKIRDIGKPLPHQGLQDVTLRIAPQEDMKMSKTNTFDDTVKVDSPPWLPQALLSYVEDRDLESLVFPFQPGQFLAVWTATCASLGI